MGEQAVIALDRQYGFPRGDLVALVERPHVHLAPAVGPLTFGSLPPGARAQDRDRLVDPAKHRLALLEDLYEHAGMEVLGLEQALRVHEVRVRVVTRPQLLDRQAKDLRIEALRHPRRHLRSLGPTTKFLKAPTASGRT